MANWKRGCDAQEARILEAVAGRPVAIAAWKLWFFLFDWVLTPFAVGWLVLTIYAAILGAVYIVSLVWHAGAR